MALQDSDNFIVSDTSGTNYKISSTSLAAYINASASGGGGGGADGNFGNGGSFPWMAFTHRDSNRVSKVTSRNINFDINHPRQNASGNGEKAGGVVFFYDYSGMTGSAQPSVSSAVMFPSIQPNYSNLTRLTDLSLSGAIWCVMLVSASDFSGAYGSVNLYSLSIEGGVFLVGYEGMSSGMVPTYYKNLNTTRGTGYITSLAHMPNLKEVAVTLTVGSERSGEYDFRNTSLSANTIAAWLLKANLDRDETRGNYFRTLRFDGGSAAAYEDLSQEAQDRITQLQDMGYTIVMNGAGGGGVSTVSAGNEAVIFETTDGRYIPVAASTTANIFPPTGSTSTEYSTLAAAKTAMDAYVDGFDGTRLFGSLSTDDALVNRFTREVNIGDEVSLDATVSHNPDNSSISYQWYLRDGNETEIIPGATSPVIQTKSITSDQLGVYDCLISFDNAATGRSLSYTKHFEVKEPVVQRTLIGSGAVDSVSVSAGGTGYSTATNVAVTGGSGTDLTVDITADSGVVTAATVNFPGEGYIDGESVTVTGGNGDAIIEVTVG